MSVMRTDAGYPPYPNVTGYQGKQKVVLSSQVGDSKMKCTTCGMAKDDNPAHADDYSGTGTHKDAGVWFETEKALADEYDSKYIPYIQQMAEKGMLGISTGSAPHLISRESVGKSMHIKSWPIVEVSLTPKPVEPRTKKSMSLKS